MTWSAGASGESSSASKVLAQRRSGEEDCCRRAGLSARRCATSLRSGFRLYLRLAAIAVAASAAGVGAQPPSSGEADLHRAAEALRLSRAAACAPPRGDAAGAQALQPPAQALSERRLAPPFTTFRTNPLLVAFWPETATAPKERVRSGSDYVATLWPYFIASLLALVALLAALPCCCCFACRTCTKWRPPTPLAAGTAFHLAFALLSLMALLTVLVSAEELGSADLAYGRAKCAAYTFLDSLVNGKSGGSSDASAASPGSQGEFIGFRSLEDAVSAASTIFPEVLTGVSEVRQQLPDLTAPGAYPAQAKAFQELWGTHFQRQMAETQFDCSLCTPSSLMLAAQSAEQLSNATLVLQQMLDKTQKFIGTVRPRLQSMMDGTLTDAVQIYSLCHRYGALLDRVLEKADIAWQSVGEAHRAALWSVVACIAMGILCLTIGYRTGTAACCAFFAWWLAVITTIGLLCLNATFLPTAVLAHDADSLLRAVLTSPHGLDDYASTLLDGLNEKARVVLGVCTLPAESAVAVGDLRSTFGVTLGQEEAHWAEHFADEELYTFGHTRLQEALMDDFFSRYASVGGERYHAEWNRSQTLGWQGESDGLGTLLTPLHVQSAECWAFHGAPGPQGCPGRPQGFDPTMSVDPNNYFYVTEAQPLDVDLQARYVTLDPQEIRELVGEFRYARAAAKSLGLAQGFNSTGCPKALAGVAAWRSQAKQLNDAARRAHKEVVAPMQRVVKEIVGLTKAAHCHAAFEALSWGSAALGRDLVAKNIALWACSALLVCCCAGMSLLFCLLWAVLDPGRRGTCCDRHRIAAYVGDPSKGNESSEDDYLFPQDGDEEVELRRPLKRWLPE
eukprot:TRINITY_DN17260_c1_g2_i1.p1 TRINITY_DN17260_c1_g2~~TRINITY_DN17260_c1_g2_i1.p1  ORF type:complete len:848 (-),score=127.81 TRINITY_DN17260_c1_g2_i1:37-2580(-)